MATSGARPEPPLIVISGPTASGKTGLAVRLAKEFGGEIISADSRAVYKGLDIGTAKPSLQEQQAVPHWGIDLVEPNERYSVADFKSYAEQKIEYIRTRGKVPFLVGGTGLYIDAVLYNFEFSTGANDNRQRQQLEQKSIEDLYEYCDQHNIKLPENYKNKRYVINAILRKDSKHKRNEAILPNTIVVGITTENEILKDRISARASQIFSPGMLEEAERAAATYGWDTEAMTGNIYPLLRQYFAGELSLDEAREKFQILDWQLAKRQRTWLKRNQDITWMTLDKAYTYLAHRLASPNK